VVFLCLTYKWKDLLTGCRYLSKLKHSCATGSSGFKRKRQRTSATATSISNNCITTESSVIPEAVSVSETCFTAEANVVSQLIPETVLVFSLSSSCDNSQPSQSCPASQSCSDLTLDSLKSMLSDLDTGSFCHVKSSKYVTFVRLSDELVPTVRISLVVDVDCVVHIAVFEKPISKQHPLWQHVPNVVKSKDDVVLLLDVLSQRSVCSGAGDPKLFNRRVLKNTSSCVEQQSGCVRSTSCELLLLHADRCLPCSRLKKQVQQRKRRQLRRTATSSNFPNKFLSLSSARTKLIHLARMTKQLKRKNKSLEVRLERCKRMCRNMVKTHGEKLAHSDSQNVIELATECTDTVLEEFLVPPALFEEILY